MNPTIVDGQKGKTNVVISNRLDCIESEKTGTERKRRMTYWLCKEVLTDNGGYLEPVNPLVRRNDCRLWKTEDCYMCNSCKVGTTLMTESDFCSKAERREKC